MIRARAALCLLIMPCASTVQALRLTHPDIRFRHATHTTFSRFVRPACVATAQHDTPRQLDWYLIIGGATMASWGLCALAALATYKPHRIVHNSIGVLQASATMPMIWAVCSSLSAAEDHSAPSCRKLNLGLAVASLWSAAAVLCAPILTAANVRTVDPVFYTPLLRLCATLVHLGTACLCLDTWRRSVIQPSLGGVTCVGV